MGRRGNRKRRTRDANAISSRDALLRFEQQLFSPAPTLSFNPRSEFSDSDVLDLDDRRRFHPEGDNRSVGSIPRSSRQLVSGAPSRGPGNHSRRVKTFSPSAEVFSEPPSSVEYDKPEDVTPCVRRKQRREVIFAENKAGRGGQKKPRWTKDSKVACRRK